MKKLILIFVAAAVMLSSLAFAKPYGEKSRPDSVGDIVFADGTATAWREGLTLTDAQKKAAVAVIFYVGTECSDRGGRRVLGVGLAQEQDGLVWCTDDANAYRENITPILCEADGDAGALTFTGDKDGSVNLEQIGAFLRENGIPDDTEYKSLYPAFYFAKNYASQAGSNVWGTKFESGWYLPTIAELFQIWKSKETVDAASKLCGGLQFGTSVYWSSSQYASTDDNAYGLNFCNGDWDANDKTTTFVYVCAVRAFTERTDFSGGTPANVDPNIEEPEEIAFEEYADTDKETAKDNSEQNEAENYEDLEYDLVIPLKKAFPWSIFFSIIAGIVIVALCIIFIAKKRGRKK